MNNMDQMAKALADSMKRTAKPKTEAYDTQAEVRRVEDGIAWVHIPGGVDETPVKLTISAKPGDVVQVRVADGRAFLVGNVSAPPTDDAKAQQALDYAQLAAQAAGSALSSAETAAEAAEDAVETANSVRGIAEQAKADAEAASAAAATADSKATAAGTAAAAAQTAADAAKADATAASAAAATADSKATAAGSAASAAQTSADNAAGAAATAGRAAAVAQAAADAAQGDIDGLEEWFWHDTNGSHILGATSGYRNDIKSTGMEIIETATEEAVAEFNADGAKVGRNYSTRLEIIPGRLTAYNAESVSFFDIDYSGSVQYEGESNITATFPNEIAATLSQTPYNIANEYDVSAVQSGSDFYFNWNKSFSVDPLSGVIDDITAGPTSSGITYKSKRFYRLFYQPDISVQFTKGTSSSHEEYIQIRIDRVITKIRFLVNYDGSNTVSLILEATIINLDSQFLDIKLNGLESYITYIETTTAPAFVLGTNKSRTKGAFSATVGEDLVAEYDNQTAIGKCNDNQQNNAFEVGNGSDDNNRSNAFEVDWNGNAKAAGNITDGSGNVLSTVASAAAAAQADATAAGSAAAAAQADATRAGSVASAAQAAADNAAALAAQKVDMTTPEYNLDTTAAAGTDDGDLYAAITALGWESEVIS